MELQVLLQIINILLVVVQAQVLVGQLLVELVVEVMEHQIQVL
jgi:hypothetical protein